MPEAALSDVVEKSATSLSTCAQHEEGSPGLLIPITGIDA